MNDQRTLIRMPALAAALGVALLLLAGVYTVAASPAPNATTEPIPDVTSAATAWSSGWQPINQDQMLTFNHNLGLQNPGLTPEQLAVELWFKDTDADGLGINRGYYGGLEDGGQWYGAHWQHLTSNSIQVYRQPDDDVAYEILVRVWIVPPPDRDSRWRTIAPGATFQFNHNLAITATDLTVGLWFSSTARGIHHFAYGGLTVDNTVPTRTLGAFWHNLTNNSVQVTRFPGDLAVEQVRVAVVHGDPPTYDSLTALGGWQDIAPGHDFTFTHNLNWNPDLLLVQGECKDAAVGGLGIHLLFAGGNQSNTGGWQGAALENLTSTRVKAFRLPDDQACDQFRVRIFKRSLQLYLPLVLNSYASP